MSTTGVKPFSMQSPEHIAKQYEGNKQKIAQAVQLGLVDATAGTLAGMFIDRMRAAATQEQAPPQTVAQQVLGSSPPAPPPGGPPMAPQAGGPPPSPMPMPQGAPPASSAAPMGGPPVRAADGGLMSIPIPDAMFDEPANGSYANGGLVAFGPGGPVEDESYNADYPYAGMRNASLLEAMNLHPRATDEEHEFRGKNYVPFSQSAMGQFLPNLGSSISEGTKSKPKQEAQAMQNNREINNFFTSVWGGTRKDVSPEELAAQKAARAPKPASNNLAPGMYATPEQLAGARARQAALGDITPTDVLKATYATGKATVQGGKQGLAAIAPAAYSARKAGNKKQEQIANAVKQATDKDTDKDTEAGGAKDLMQDAIDKVHKYYADPEYEKFMNGQESRLSKQKKEDVWTTLAQIGFSMAASKSPTLLGAIGEAGSAAMPNAMKALQARRAAESDLAKQRMETRRAEVTTGIGVAQNAEQVVLKREEMQQVKELARDQIHAQLEIAERNNSTQLQAARIAAERAGDTDYKWSISTKAAALFATGKYKTLGEATNAAMDAYLKTVHPTKTEGTPIATALGGAGGGKNFSFNSLN